MRKIVLFLGVLFLVAIAGVACGPAKQPQAEVKVPHAGLIAYVASQFTEEIVEKQVGMGAGILVTVQRGVSYEEIKKNLKEIEKTFDFIRKQVPVVAERDAVYVEIANNILKTRRSCTLCAFVFVKQVSDPQLRDPILMKIVREVAPYQYSQYLGASEAAMLISDPALRDEAFAVIAAAR